MADWVDVEASRFLVGARCCITVSYWPAFALRGRPLSAALSSSAPAARGTASRHLDFSGERGACGASRRPRRRIQWRLCGVPRVMAIWNGLRQRRFPFAMSSSDRGGGSPSWHPAGRDSRFRAERASVQTIRRTRASQSRWRNFCTALWRHVANASPRASTLDLSNGKG